MQITRSFESVLRRTIMMQVGRFVVETYYEDRQDRARVR